MLNKPFEAEARLNNIKEFSPHRKENTTLHHYKEQLMLFKEIILVYSESHTRPINIK
jgi:hypothetical protein